MGFKMYMPRGRQPPPPPPSWVGGRVSGEPKPHRLWRRFLQAAADTGIASSSMSQHIMSSSLPSC